VDALVALRRAVRAELEKFAAGDLVLVAVSGGADSLALAFATDLEASKLAIRVAGVTVDHQLQPESSEQANKVVNQLKIECHVAKVNVEVTDGLEASARRARYEALESIAKSEGAAAVFLGHTKDDQAETVLLGLARGSGARSLAGMALTNGLYVRPFLNNTRMQTLAACKELNLTPWNDPHNDDESFLRVKVRKNVLPNMERELGPGISDALVRSAHLLRDDADALDELAKDFWQNNSSLEVEELGRSA
jgi:tRNA(Ile)-lysidine synthase